MLAAWLNSRAFGTAAKREKTLDALIRGRFDTAILFGPRFGGHPGYGDSGTFKTFSQMVRDAGLAIHVWINCSRHKPFPDFTNAGTRAAYAKWAADLVAEYNPDGIHLDYIRWNTSSAVDGRMQAVTAMVQAVHNVIGDKQLSASQFALGAAWGERYKNPPNWPYPVPEWFKRWYADNPNSIYDNVPYPRGNYVGIPNYMRYQQNGLEWPIDMLMPMEYTSNPNTWKQRVDLWHSHHLAAECQARLVMGIQTRPNADPAESAGMMPADLVDCVQYARDRGIGTCLFQIGSWDDEQFIDALSVLAPEPEPDVEAVISNMQARARALRIVGNELDDLALQIEADIGALT